MDLYTKAISGQRSSVQEMCSKDLKSFQEGIRQMEFAYKISDFGYRTIDKLGKSAVLSTNQHWPMITSEQGFMDAMIEHVNAEILYVKRNKLNFITRSRDRVNNPFLQSLEENKMNNSIVNFKFLPNRIELFYFYYDLNQPEHKDLLLNNIDRLRSLTDSMAAAFEFINERVLRDRKEKLLQDSTNSYLWQNDKEYQQKKQMAKVIYRGQELYFSYQEATCLCQIKLSNKSLARNLGISEAAIKWHVANLKRKLDIYYRDDLQEVSEQVNKQLKLQGF